MTYHDGGEATFSGGKFPEPKNQPVFEVDTDEYLGDPDHYKAIESMGVKVNPVDMNDAYVALDKYGKKNLDITEENMQRRFSLQKGGES